jgi:hypothetical protein
MNPVAIPSGGIMIFLAETAVRDSRTRQIITAIAPTIEVTSDITFRGAIVMKSILRRLTPTSATSRVWSSSRHILLFFLF